MFLHYIFSILSIKLKIMQKYYAFFMHIFPHIFFVFLFFSLFEENYEIIKIKFIE